VDDAFLRPGPAGLVGGFLGVLAEEPAPARDGGGLGLGRKRRGDAAAGREVLGRDVFAQLFADHPGADLLDRAGLQRPQLERPVRQPYQPVDGQAQRLEHLADLAVLVIQRLAPVPPSLALSSLASIGP
jgi:hypothetical protein